jgi:hypothetical protein
LADRAIVVEAHLVRQSGEFYLAVFEDFILTVDTASSEQTKSPPSAFSVSSPVCLGGLRPRKILEQSQIRLKCLRPGSAGLLEHSSRAVKRL